MVSRNAKVILIVALLLAGLTVPLAWQTQVNLSSISVSLAPKNLEDSQKIRSLTVRFQPGVFAYRGGTVPGANLIHGVEITLGHSYRDAIETLSFSQPLTFEEATRVGEVLKKAGVVEFADVMLPLQESDPDPLLETCTDTAIGNDPCRSQQDWWMNEIGAYIAWNDAGANTPGVTVAVLDTGSRNHPDLTTTTSQWVNGYDMIGLSNAYSSLVDSYRDFEGGQYTSAGDGGGRDADATDIGTGRDDNTCHRDGFVVDRPSIYPLAIAKESSWHGTRVAGIISAQTSNGIGLSGIAPHVKIQPVRVLGKCTESDDVYNLPDGIDWASGETVATLPVNTRNVQVINMSIGSLYPSGYPCPAVYQNAINRALAKGIIVVASAGNHDSPAGRHIPSACAGVISVGASTRAQTRSSYSNYDADVSAPGGELGSDNTQKILMMTDSGTINAVSSAYKYGQGTSMSSPMVAAAAAMARTKYPFGSNPLHSANAIKIALMYAASLGTQCTGCGSGILNIPTFLGVLSPTATPSLVLGTSATQGQGAKISVTWTAPKTAAWNPITSYSVFARNIAGSLIETCTKNGGETLNCEFNTLAQDTQYGISITATRGGTSSSIESVPITTRRQARPPTQLAAAATNNGATFSWTEPTDLGGDALGDLAELQVYSSQNGDEVIQSCYANSSPCEINGLDPGTTYWADVKRWANFFGFTQTSTRVQFTTTGSAVSPTTTTTVAPTVSTTAPSVTTTVAPTVTTTVTNTVVPTVARSGSSDSTSSTNGSTTSSSQNTSYKSGASVTKSKLLTLAKLAAPSSAKYKLTVSASSKKICKVLGTAIKTLKKGTCQVTVTVTPKGKKATAKSLKLKVT